MHRLTTYLARKANVYRYGAIFEPIPANGALIIIKVQLNLLTRYTVHGRGAKLELTGPFQYLESVQKHENGTLIHPTYRPTQEYARSKRL